MSTAPTTIPGIPNINFAEIESFVETADKVLPLIAPFFPPAGQVHAVVVPILEGLLKIGQQFQAGSDPTQLMPLIAAEFHAIANAVHPASAIPPAAPATA